jgi:hypothetical protein
MGYSISGKGAVSAITQSARTAKEALAKAKALRDQGIEVTVTDAKGKVVSERKLKTDAKGT